ncbi:MAG TPA: sugar phosphate isomerase/epimerase [Candidatus Faecaligallichristensenella faecipullorum]|nr:sugar phosphate isomerase/epimerase [Candidatus Faecaligallichristensenella faecipullorum]
MTSFLIGAQLFSMRDRTQTPEDLLATLKALKAVGYNSVQLSGQGAMPDEQIAGMLKETGMIAPATHISMDMFENHLDETIRRHKLWGSEYPGLGAMPDKYRSAEGYKAFAREISLIAKKLKDNGLQFIYHNHAFEFAQYDGVTGYQILLDNASEDVQFEMDTYWVQAGGGDPVEWIEKLKGRMDVVHFKDMTGCNENRPLMVPGGTGNMNWKRIFEACEKIGVKYAFIEQDNAVETDSLACMTQAIKSMSALGGRF